MWYPENPIERELAWALSGRNYARYFRAFADAPLYLPFRPDESADGPAVTEAYGWPVLSVFTSEAGVLATWGEPVDWVVTSFPQMRDSWPEPAWRLAINPGLPIEAVLPVTAVEQVMQGELIPGPDSEVVIRPLLDGDWEPWPPGGANEALLAAAERGDGAEYLDALLASVVIVPTSRPISEPEVLEFAQAQPYRQEGGSLPEWAREQLAQTGVRQEVLDGEFPWRPRATDPEPTIEMFTDARFLPYTFTPQPDLATKFLTLVELLPPGHALAINPGGPAGLDLRSDQIGWLTEWRRSEPVPSPILLGMRWIQERAAPDQ